MRIAVLAHALHSGGGMVGGQNFIHALRNAAPEHDYLVFVPRGKGYENIQLPTHSEFYFSIACEGLARLKFELLVLPKIIRRFNPSAILGLGNFGMLNPPAPQAIWIRNAYLVYPKESIKTGPLKNQSLMIFQRYYLKKCLRKTDLVFCQTPVMKKHLSTLYSINEDRVKILPNALSRLIVDNDKTEPETPQVLKERKTGDFYCLIPSKYYTHKNPEILLEFLKHADRREISNIKFIITLSPDDHPGVRRFFRELSKYDRERQVINVGRIPHDVLVNYYRNVDLVIMPTLLESFSVTYLEAMHFNVPILTTDLDFAHYLCGRAACYYVPSDYKDFIDKLIYLKRNAEKRNDLIRAGQEHLKLFNYGWRDIVRLAVDGLENLVKAKG